MYDHSTIVFLLRPNRGMKISICYVHIHQILDQLTEDKSSNIKYLANSIQKRWMS